MNIDDATITYSIPDELCKQTGITAKWINEDKFSIYGYNHITSSTKDVPTKYTNTGPINIYHYQSEFIFDEPIVRSLVAEASTIFKTVQEISKQESRPDYLKISRTYRSTVRACLEKLNDSLDEIGQTDRTEDQGVIGNYITIFYSVECVWHLCEILLIDPAPSNIVVPQLLNWVRFHFPAYEREAAELLFIDSDDIDGVHVLSVIKGLITQGQVEVARTLLRLHPAASNNASFQIAEEVLRSMPTYNAYGGLSLQKFRSQWQYWVTDTESKLATGCMAAEPELEEILKLVSGNTEAWLEHARDASCWYEHLPGYLFYTEPGCKYFELGTFADRWLRQWARMRGINPGSLKHLDRVIFKVMENDMHQVIHDIQNMCDNKWFVTHLTDLLFHCGQLQILGEQQTNVTAALRESLLFDFGASLMSRNSLWLIGIDYLDNSSTEGIGAIEILLSRIPINNEKQALKILNVAKQKGFQDIEREICRIEAVKSLRNKRLGNALEWALRSQDSIFVSSVADIFLEHYSKTGEMLCPDILANMGPKMLISPRLVFLAKYFEFHEHYKSGEFPQAAELLVSLLDSKIAPEYFWPSLLADTIPLLESKEPQFSSKETYTILHHLENQLIPLIDKKMDLFKCGKTKTLQLLNDCRIENILDVVKLIRLACSRNLSRALIIENTNFS